MAVNYWTLNDYSGEKSTFRVHSENITAANFAAQETERTALFTALAVLQLGTLAKSGYGNESIGVSTLPTNVYAQRELKWLISYEGFASGKKFQVELPIADLTGNLVVGTDLADVTSTEWAAFITAFEAFVKSPDDPAEAVIFLGARLVGRNI
jgi:hypothetical protein